MATRHGPADVAAVNRHEVGALCLAALDAVGARGPVAELLIEAALFAEDRGTSVVGVAHPPRPSGCHARRLDGRAVLDQASRSTAFVPVRDAAAQGTPLPEGWAVAADGVPATEPGAVPLRPTAWRSGRTSSPPSATAPAAPPLTASKSASQNGGGSGSGSGGAERVGSGTGGGVGGGAAR